jgi:3-methyladenine DNA glycosylase AlkD
MHEPGAATARATAFVAARRAEAEALGHDLADDLGDPDRFARRLGAGFTRLGDPDYREGQALVAPGIGPLLGVRWPLHAAVARAFRRATTHDRPSTLLFVADRLFRDEPLELRWFALGLLERTLPAEPAQSWQLLRRAAREAADWITVDTLARPYARGITLERYRWAELEQLVYSASRWERRLVGSTVATLPHVDRSPDRSSEIVAQGLPLLEQLMGDAEPEVQKALAWAFRTLAELDPAATTAALEGHAELAARARDGHRAWVVRDALRKIDPTTATALRDRLAGVRRRSDAPATSPAAVAAARFGAAPE